MRYGANGWTRNHDDVPCMPPRETWRRVYRGVRLLDADHNGERIAWAIRVEPKRIDLRDVHGCILGQVYRDREGDPDGNGYPFENGYRAGVAMLAIDCDGDDFPGEPYGFVVADDEDSEQLTRIWQRAVTYYQAHPHA